MRPRRTHWPSLHGWFAECRWLGVSAVLGFTVAALAVAAFAGAPPNPDPQLAPWFQGLTRPWRPGSAAMVKCCDIADCRVTSYRETGDHYEALIDQRFPGVAEPSWQEVAPEAVLDFKDNPTGGAVACWHRGQVLCFVRPAEM
jgi:hypothetical protein